MLPPLRSSIRSYCQSTVPRPGSQLPNPSRLSNRTSARTMVEQLPKLPEIERLSPRVIRVLGGNPGKFSLQGTNTYIVGSGPERLLIDTGEGRPVWAETIQKVLSDEKIAISDVLLTHWHPDHVGGVQQILDLHDSKKPKIHKNQPDHGQTNYDDGHVFKTEGATLKAFHSPGHTVDHMAFILEEEDAMFTGDNVLGHGTAVFEDLASYMDSLERMQHQFSGRAYPGHGAVIDDGRAKIREYIAHRQQREQETLNVLKEKKPGSAEGWESMEMVKLIYKAYPESLHLPAEGSLRQVLGKLEGDGKVKRFDDGSWGLGGKAAL